MNLNEFPAIQQEGDNFFVMSQQGKVLGKFDTIEAAKDFKRNYSSLKQYSSTVNEVGSREAMQRFKENIRKNLLGG